MTGLDKYAGTVIWSWVATLVLMVAITALTLWRGARVKAALREVEDRRKAAKEAGK